MAEPGAAAGSSRSDSTDCHGSVVVFAAGSAGGLFFVDKDDDDSFCGGERKETKD